MKKKAHTEGGKLRCPVCNSAQTITLKRRYDIKHGINLRTYMCKECANTFKTIELVFDGDTQKIMRYFANEESMTYNAFVADFKKTLDKFIEDHKIDNINKLVNSLYKYRYLSNLVKYIKSSELSIEDTIIISSRERCKQLLGEEFVERED